MKIRITISLKDGTSQIFKTGKRALSYAWQEWAVLDRIKIKTIKRIEINGEVCGISQLEELTDLETLESEHNKR